MKSPVDGDAEAIGHRSPHRRIDPMYPDRLAVATREDLNRKIRNGAKLSDLEAMYRFEPGEDLFYLKDGYL